ncbi:MAG: NnrS family protein [Verrucomicrobiales bacterium]|nr:NnrS family protein [Verrucomicrobiales bacterium]
MNPNTKDRRYETLDDCGPLWAGEPFRIFFPLGMCAAVIGVLLWPLFYSGIWRLPPLLQHPRVMIFGFGGAFLCGFLGTAWPRFLEAEALRAKEVILLVCAWMAAMVFILSGHLQYGDFAFGVFLLLLLVILLRRLRKDRDVPPPGFALAMVSVVLSSAAAFLWALAPLQGGLWLINFSRLILWQGMLLLPLMGVGSYLFARFFQEPGKKPVAATPKNRAVGVWLGAILVVASFAVEASGQIRLGSGVRFVAIVVWVLLASPALWKGKASTSRAWALRIAVGSIALTCFVRMIWPGPGHAFAHVLFIGGFGLTLLLVADRVTHGHCGDISQLPKKSRLWRWIVWLALLAVATRASADFKTSLIISHHSYAALLWSAVVVAFAWCTAGMWRKSN